MFQSVSRHGGSFRIGGVEGEKRDVFNYGGISAYSDCSAVLLVRVCHQGMGSKVEQGESYKEGSVFAYVFLSPRLGDLRTD